MATERNLKDLWYVDDCSNCKDLELFYEKDVPCVHPWYCHYEEPVKSLEFEITLCRDSDCACDKHKLKELLNRKFELKKELMRKYRRNEHGV